MRIAPGPYGIRLEADIAQWPKSIVMGRKGMRFAGTVPLGEDEFDLSIVLMVGMDHYLTLFLSF